MKTLSPDDVKALRAQLDARQPQQQERDRKVREEIQKCNATMKMLERRTRELSFDLDLGNGDQIGIRTHLSPAELSRMSEIMDLRGRLQETTKGILESKPDDMDDRLKECADVFDDLWLEIIAIITTDPTITTEWLRANSDLISKEDMLTMYLGYVEGQKRVAEGRKELVERAISFRKDSAGPGVRPVADQTGDPRPESVGKSPRGD
jgi:hypothetical protein